MGHFLRPSEDLSRQDIALKQCLKLFIDHAQHIQDLLSMLQGRFAASLPVLLEDLAQSFLKGPSSTASRTPQVDRLLLA